MLNMYLDKITVADQKSLLLAAGIGVGVITAGGLLYYFQFRKRLPRNWVKVAEVTDLMYFPLKSCAPCHDIKFYCDWLGPTKHGVLRDRILLVIDKNGKAITARDHPELVLIEAKFRYSKAKGLEVAMKAPEMETELVIRIDKLDKRNKIKAVVWGDVIQAIDCGKQAALWISTYTMHKVEGYRMVFYPKRTSRQSQQYITPLYPNIELYDYGSFTDLTTYMLMSEESVQDLNTRLTEPVPLAQFRPNIVIKGGDLYDEENWNYIKIGDAVFQNVKPCTRCMSTTVNPITGTKHPEAEPLRTLRTYKQLEDIDKRKLEKFAPVLGMHMGLRKRGVIKVGDAVYRNVPES